MKGYDIADDYIIKVLHMNIDFSKLLKSTKSDDIEPRDIHIFCLEKTKNMNIQEMYRVMYGKNGLNVGKIKTTL